MEVALVLSYESPYNSFEKLIENHFATVPGTFLNRVRV